jgi:hypothetical protein
MVMVCQIDVTQQDKPQKPDQSIEATTTTKTPPPPPLPQPQPTTTTTTTTTTVTTTHDQSTGGIVRDMLCAALTNRKASIKDLPAGQALLVAIVCAERCTMRAVAESDERAQCGVSVFLRCACACVCTRESECETWQLAPGHHRRWCRCRQQEEPRSQPRRHRCRPWQYWSNLAQRTVHLHYEYHLHSLLLINTCLTPHNRHVHSLTSLTRG